MPDDIIQNVTELQIKWIKPPGEVKYYTITTNCSCNCNPIVNHTGDETKALVTGLVAGTHCSIKITAVSGGRYSQPLIYEDIETLEISKTLFRSKLLSYYTFLVMRKVKIFFKG